MTLLLVFFHILGVIVSSYVDKEKLVKAMLTGKKDIDDTYQ
jgi:cytochrome b